LALGVAAEGNADLVVEAVVGQGSAIAVSTQVCSQVVTSVHVGDLTVSKGDQVVDGMAAQPQGHRPSGDHETKAAVRPSS